MLTVGGSAASRSSQCILGLGSHRGDQVLRRGQVGDEIDGLSRPNRLRGDRAACHVVLVVLKGLGIGGEVGLPAAPAVEVRVAEGADGVREDMRPRTGERTDLKEVARQQRPSLATQKSAQAM